MTRDLLTKGWHGFHFEVRRCTLTPPDPRLKGAWLQTLLTQP
jgi:hypothetical protein